MAILSNNGVGSQGPKVFGRNQSLVRDTCKLVFSFPTNGSSNPATKSGRGIDKVVHTSTGLYTVTLHDYWAQLLAAKAHLAMATPNGSIAQIVGGSWSASGLTIQITTLNSSGVAADIAAATGNVVSVKLRLYNGSFGPP